MKTKLHVVDADNEFNHSNQNWWSQIPNIELQNGGKQITVFSIYSF